MASSSQDNNLIVQFLIRLNQENIRYCHWKSNAFIDLSLNGTNDLDLLILREDTQKFLEILFSLGFKEATGNSFKQIPGVRDFYGFDPSIKEFVHVHAHYQLVVGHDATKNYHISIEEAYISSAKLNGVVKIPSAEFEFMILVIRMVLKHLTWDSALRRESHLNKNEIFELSSLKNEISLQKIQALLINTLPMLEWENFRKCSESLLSQKFGFRNLHEGQKLSSALKNLSRKPAFNVFWKKLMYRIIDFYRRRILKDPFKKQFNSGGLLISVLGGDGSGKTTLIKELKDWIGSEFETKSIHIGKPSWSFSTVMIRGLLKITRILHLHPFLKAPVKYTRDTQQIVFPGYPWAIREVCTAHDRLKAYKKARSYTSNGGIMICDRYPIPGIQFMESSQIRRMSVGIKNNWFLSNLISKEENYYKNILPADLMILLRVNPDVAVSRKTEEDAEEVHNRTQEIFEHDWSNQKIIVIDANQSKEIVLNSVKQIVWSHV